MKTMKKIITLSITALLLAALGTSTSFAGKPAPGGGGGKIKVFTANPSEAPQGSSRTVTITGENFVDISEVRFLVGRTKDSLQITTGNIHIISTKELEVDIEVNSAALTVDYDIEVQATSGRKGKGTTLFKVSKNTESCTANPFPVIAYITTNRTDDIFDIALLDSEGCKKQYLMNDEPSGGDVKSVRLTYVAPHGAVVWIESVHVDPDASSTTNSSRIWVVRFEIVGGLVVADDPVKLVETEVHGQITEAEIFFDVTGNAALAYYYWSSDVENPIRKRLIVISGLSMEDLAAGGVFSSRDNDCVQLDIYGNCSNLRNSHVRWSKDGSAIYFYSLGDANALMKGVIVDGKIASAEILLPIPELEPYGFSSDDSLLVSAFIGQIKGNKRVIDVRVFPVTLCMQIGCTEEDGELVFISDTTEISNHKVRWSSADTIVWLKQNSAGKAEIREFSIITGEIRTLHSLSLSNGDSLDSIDTSE